MEKQRDIFAVSEDEDPMKFIEASEKHHDWTVLVKDPHSQSEKEFSVVSLNLAAHSCVFRRMMSDPKWVSEKRLVIPNMSPQTFDLIYRYVNAAELGLQALSREDIADLTVAADMYMIPRLVRKGCKHLVPRNVEEVFPALTVVSFIPNTELEPLVAKFVQLNTQDIVASDKFLLLDGRCIEFITKQEFLTLSELELWRILVKRSQHQVVNKEGETVRSALGGVLRYIRFRTLTQEDIVKEVAPTNALRPEELATLLCAVIGKQPWNQSELSNSETTRQLESAKIEKPNIVIEVEEGLHPPLEKPSSPLCIFNTEKSYHYLEKYISKSLAQDSTFTIETKKAIELQSFIFQGKPLSELNGSQFYSISCKLILKKQVNECYSPFCTISIKKVDLFSGDKVFSVPATNSSNDLNVILEANTKYHFTVSLSPAHMTHDLCIQEYYGSRLNTQTKTSEERTVKDVMTVQFHSPVHVHKIQYKILS